MIDPSRLAEIVGSVALRAAPAPTSMPALVPTPALMAPTLPPAQDGILNQKPIPIQTPPGLPQTYIDANLQEQPIPQPMTEEMAQEQAKPLSYEITPGVSTMCQRECISYRPGPEVKLTQSRIDQGPRVFLSLAQKAAFDRGYNGEKKKESRGAPTLPQPDTSRAGTFIRGESAPYRPGA